MGFWYINRHSFSNISLSTQRSLKDINKRTTWGSGGKETIIDNYKDLNNAVQGNFPKIIKIKGEIKVPNTSNIPWEEAHYEILVGSNTSIIGIDSGAKIVGNGFVIDNQNNIIIKNIAFENAYEKLLPNQKWSIDNITIKNSSTNIWIDHCSFSDWTIGMNGSGINDSINYDWVIDITNWSNYILISYSYFTNHRKVILIGNDDFKESDKGKLKVVLHHNFFDSTLRREPRVRYWEVYIFNNCYKNIGWYTIGIGKKASVYSEKNIFINSKSIRYMDGYWWFVDIGSNPIITDQRGKVSRKPKEYYINNVEKTDNLAEICIKYSWPWKPER